MLHRLVSQHSQRYEAWKDACKRFIPLPGSLRSSLSASISTIHQRYFEDFVFIHINKCGGTSVERALGIPLLNHDTALERRAKLGETRWAARFKFSVVRNPYDRIASLFYYRHRKQPRILPADAPGRFTEWLGGIRTLHESGAARKTERPQLAWITDETGQVIVDHLCRLEQLETGLKVVRRELGRSLTVKQLKQGTRPEGYQSLYGPASRELVNHLFDTDFERLEYPTIAP